MTLPRDDENQLDVADTLQVLGSPASWERCLELDQSSEDPLTEGETLG